MRLLKLLKFLVFPTIFIVQAVFFHFLFVISDPVLLARRAWFCSGCIVLLCVMSAGLCREIRLAFDKAIDRPRVYWRDRQGRYFLTACGRCDYCANGWMCPYTSLKPQSRRRRAFFDL
jgi:hypothetical protein